MMTINCSINGTNILKFEKVVSKNDEIFLNIPKVIWLIIYLLSYIIFVTSEC